MNGIESFDDESESEPKWKTYVIWSVIVAVSIELFLLTFSPLLAAVLPYGHAAWPAVRTAFWLRASDPWRARGRVGFYFHMAMAGFRAGVVGFASLMVMVFISTKLNRQPDLTQLGIAVSFIFGGCVNSTFMGWIGYLIARRNGVRIFVVSNLFKLCRGDFSRIPVVLENRFQTNPFSVIAGRSSLQTSPGQERELPPNPARYVMAIAITSPLVMIWCFFLLLAAPPRNNVDMDWTLGAIAFLLLPVIEIAGGIIVSKLVSKTIAQTPLECWGAPVPEQTKTESNWYQRGQLS